jgi:hypothetical protein
MTPDDWRFGIALNQMPKQDRRRMRRKGLWSARQEKRCMKYARRTVAR